MKQYTFFTVSLLFAILAIQSAAPRAAARGTQRRVALVIGNAGYAAGPIPQAKSDARDTAAALRRLGFSVTVETDRSRKDMRQLIRDFGAGLTPSTVALFYYSGHGVQVAGKNYLIPVGADIRRQTDVEDEAVSVDQVLRELAERGPACSIVILDACRDNPLPAEVKDLQKGLIVKSGPKGSLVCFAASEGETARAKAGEVRSVYTDELLKHLSTPGLRLTELFARVRDGVGKRTAGNQTPEERSKLGAGQDLVLTQRSAGPTAKHVPGETRRNLIDGAEMVWVPGGEFVMGRDAPESSAEFRRRGWPESLFKRDDAWRDYYPGEGPAHRVEVDGFWMYRTEVTGGQFRRFCEATGRAQTSTAKGDDYPVANVDWRDSAEYCRWAGGRLPTEAEWEFAACAGNTGLNGTTRSFFPWGDGLPRTADRVGNLADTAYLEVYKDATGAFAEYDDGEAWAAPVARYRPNAFGLHDLGGNLSEWCSDFYSDGYYETSEKKNPRGPSLADNRQWHVVRGPNLGTAAFQARTTRRSQASPGYSSQDLGFRMVIDD